MVEAALADGTIYTSDAPRAAALNTRHAQIEEELMTCLERWETLASR